MWQPRDSRVHVLFAGRGAPPDRGAALTALAPEAPPPAWLRQIHSARVLEAKAPGQLGEGDALITRRNDLALCIVTADCCPILLAGDGGIAAVHAGWRGVAQNVAGAAVAQLGAPASIVAWIGPAIGPCCYEVGEEVAEQVAAASHGEVVHPRPPGRPRLDLAAAVRHQLQVAGVPRVEIVAACTRCHSGQLFSYRREGPGGGRNLAFIWRS